MPALRGLLGRRKGSPIMSGSTSGNSPIPAPAATSPRTAAQLARAAFFSTPPSPAAPAASRASTPPSPTLHRYGSTVSLNPSPRALASRGRVKSADVLDVAPLLSRQRSCDSLGESGCGGGGVIPPAPAKHSSRMRATSCYNVLQFLRDRTCPRPSHEAPLRKCSTTAKLQGLLEPVRPINRLRVPGFQSSRVCSRCSSILSLASSSRYSLHASAASFAPLTASARTPSPAPSEEKIVLCKLCLADVPESLTTRLEACQCVFCKECMKAYIMFEILEGAYDISCPDALCERQGVVAMTEIEDLIEQPLVDKHQRFRLNREVDRDATRTWCPRAGCETVCTLCSPAERCQPQPVYCPSCESDFCSSCRAAWHPDASSCEENQRRLAARGLLPEPPLLFDSDLIKCCPMCAVPIEKDEGCAQMMCKRCKHVFCWYCLASLDDDFLLRHYDKGPCKNKLGHSRASVIWHRTQVIGIFAGFGILLLVASPLLLLAAPCIVCCKCRVCGGAGKLDGEEEQDLPGDASAGEGEESAS